MPNITSFALSWRYVVPDAGSTDLVIILLTVRSVADVMVGCFCDSAISRSDMFALLANCPSTYYVVAFVAS